MEKISNYVLPVNTNSLYQNEASSAIGLTRDVADKLNELIDAYNALSEQDLEWKQTQEGTIRKAIIYIKDNLYNTIQDLFALVDLNELLNTDTQELIIKRSEELQDQIKSLASGAPFQANGIAQMTDKARIYVNIQDGQWYYFSSTDNQWKAGGVYQASQIEDNSITSEKRTVVGDYGYLISEKGSITINLDTQKISVNNPFVLTFRDHIITIEPTEIQIPTKESYMLYFDIEERRFQFHRPSNDLYKANENCIYIGYISTTSDNYNHLNASRYDVIYNGVKTTFTNGTKLTPTRQADLLSGKVEIDTAGNEITFTNAVFSLGYKYVTITSSLSYTEVSEGRIKYVCFDTVKNSVKIFENRNSENLEEVLLFAFYQKKIYHSYVNRHLYYIDGVNESSGGSSGGSSEGASESKLKGLKAVFFGDSITRGAGSSIPFTQYLAEATGMSVQNEGVDGYTITGITSASLYEKVFYDNSWKGQYDSNDNYTSHDFKIIGIMGGTNDYWRNISLGQIYHNSHYEQNPYEFAGSFENIVRELQSKYPKAFIFLMTPIKGYRGNRSGEGLEDFYFPSNDNGNTLIDFVKAVKDVGDYCGVPVLDLHSESGLNPVVLQNDQQYFTDGVHPNSEGYKVIAKCVENFLETHFNR